MFGVNAMMGANPFLQVQYMARPQRMAQGMPAQPVTPVQPAPTVQSDQGARRPTIYGPIIREGVDPVEMAVRGRIQYMDQPEQAAQLPQLGGERTAQPAEVPQGQQAAQPVQLPAQPGQSPKGEEQAQPGVELPETKSAQETMEEGTCQTCKERKYQDGSDDPGVSFKTPTNVAPQMAASAVRGHEMEHVVREQAKATREDRKVVSQSVTYHTAICPECGKTYVSGGTTRTTTKANPKAEQYQQPQEQKAPGFEAVA